MLRPHEPFAFSGRLTKEGPDFINDKISVRVKDLPVFQDRIFKQRSLFSPLLEKKLEPQQERFILLGIISVGDKKAAMIRDPRENEDYYCLGGETIGTHKVKQVLNDRVILESGGEILEISR